MTRDATSKLKKQAQQALVEVTGGKLDGLEESIVSTVFGFVAASMVAVSTYVYMI